MSALVSILDLAFISEGSTAADALAHSLDLAQHAERWGYRRFWLAEHHNMPGIASAATSVVIGFVAGGTRTIRVRTGHGAAEPATPPVNVKADMILDNLMEATGWILRNSAR